MISANAFACTLNSISSVYLKYIAVCNNNNNIIISIGVVQYVCRELYGCRYCNNFINQSPSILLFIQLHSRHREAFGYLRCTFVG